MKFPSPVDRVRLIATVSLGCILLAGCTSSEFATAKEKASKGDPQAQLDLAQMYLYGKGAKQDHAEAIKWCEQAANKGLPAAQRVYGIMIRDGYGVPRNLARGRAWLEKAAKQGDADAKAELNAMPNNPAPPVNPPKQ